MLTSPFLRWLDKIYGFFVFIGSNLQSIFLLYMRLTWGHQLFLNGLADLEKVLGVCLFFGFASRVIAIPIIIGMMITLTTVHGGSLAGFQFVINPHSLTILQPYPFLITALIIFAFGPGRISIDAWLKRWIEKQPRY